MKSTRAVTNEMPMDATPQLVSQIVPVDKKRKVEEDAHLQVPNTILTGCHYEGSEDSVTTLPGSLEVNGRVKARFFTQFSDIRLKVNITDIVDAIEIVTKLQGKTYEWKSNEFSRQEPGGRRVIGLIAQEVYSVLPEIVHEDKETGLLSVSYTELIPVLIEAFKQFLKGYEEDKSAMRMQLDDMKGKLEILSGKLDKADQDYMPNLQKAIADLKAATRNFVDSYHQYALSLIEREVNAVKKTAQGIVDTVTGSVNAKYQYVRDTVYGVTSTVMYVRDTISGVSSKIQDVPPGFSGKYQYAKDSMWVLSSLVIARRAAGG